MAETNTSFIDSLTGLVNSGTQLVTTYNNAFVPVPTKATPSAPIASGAAPSAPLAPTATGNNLFGGISGTTILLGVAGLLAAVLIWKKA